MDSALPPKDAVSPSPANISRTEQHGVSTPSAAFSILQALVGDRIPKGPLGPENVPAAMLAIPISYMTEDLVDHCKHCQAPTCRHIPPLLQSFRRMRPETIRTEKVHIHKALWTHPNHELVTRIRQRILKENAALAEEVSTGKLFAGGRLGEALSELGANGPRILAATIWAGEFKGDGAEIMFRMLVPLVQANAPQKQATDEGANPEDDREQPLKDKRKALFKERELAKRAADQATRDLQQKTQALEKTNRELVVAKQSQDQLARQLKNVQSRHQDALADYRALQKDLEKGARINAALRKDLGEMKQSQAALDIRCSDLARQLAAERRLLKQVKLELDTTPVGSAGIMAFLRSEDERIKMDRMIKQGGDKQRAEQERERHRNLREAFLAAYPEYRQPAPVRIRPKSSLRLRALGGSNEIGRSCYLLELGSRQVLVDCGIKPGVGNDLQPAIEGIERLDALILTHAHTDHVGWVPALVRRFPDLDIYCSDGTAALLPVMLEDSHQHYSRRLAVERERTQYVRNAEVPKESYDLGDVNRVSRIVSGCNFDEDVELPFGGTTIRFYKAGHVLGASSVLIRDESGRKIFLSGDFSSFDQLTVGAAEWPRDLGEIDLLVLESTYGNRSHSPLDETRRALVLFVRSTLENGGSVILASFGLGRAQELLKLLTSARMNGEMPSAPVYVDGMIKRINRVYERLASFDLPSDAFYEVSGEYERHEVAVAAQKTPSIIVTTSGMLSGGPVVHYAQQLLPDRRHRLVLTGYQDRGAPSRALREVTAPGRRTVTVEDERGEKVTFEAAMPAKEYGLSAHADQPGLIEYAGRMQPKHIALVHGEADAQQELRRCLLRVHPQAEIYKGPTDLPLP